MRSYTSPLAALALLFSSLPVAAQDDEAPQRPVPGQAGTECINADDIVSYHTVSDELVRFELKGHDALARLRKSCPQLHFHGYISYQPVNGMLCARFDDLVNRSGMPCRIDSFTMTDHKDGDETTEEAQQH